MRSVDADTIKGMNIALAVKVDPKNPAAKTKKSRTRRSCCIKSRELVESDSDSDDKSTKTAGEKDAKSTSKLAAKPTDTETKTI